MSETTSRTLIVVALIGVAGTIGAAFIGNYDKLSSGDIAQANERPAQPADAGTTPASRSAAVGPHAPEIEINPSFSIWGESTMLVRLVPGQSKVLKAMNLYEERTTFPASSCAGPGFVPYTWQVRQPWPKGGDIEFRSVIPRAGGATERVGLGSYGSGEMTYCGEHIVKNTDVELVSVEIRYASAAYPDEPEHGPEIEQEAVEAANAAPVANQLKK